MGGVASISGIQQQCVYLLGQALIILEVFLVVFFFLIFHFQHSSIAAQFTYCSHCYGSTETVVCLSNIDVPYSNETWYFRIISEWCSSN